MYSASQESVLRFLLLICGLFSLLLCLYVIIGWFCVKKRPKLSDLSALILFLALSDAFLSLDFVIEGLATSTDTSNHDVYCYMRASVVQYFSLSSLIWTGVMSHACYMNLRDIFVNLGARNYSTSSPRVLMMRIYHSIAWGIPLVSIIVMFAAGGAGITGDICWISSDKQWLRVLIFFIPVILIEGYNVYIFRCLLITCSRIPNGDVFILKFKRYLAFVIASKGLMLISGMQDLINPQESVFAITALSVLSMPLQSIADAIMFGFHPEICCGVTSNAYSAANSCSNPIWSSTNADGSFSLDEDHSSDIMGSDAQQPYRKVRTQSGPTFRRVGSRDEEDGHYHSTHSDESMKSLGIIDDGHDDDNVEITLNTL